MATPVRAATARLLCVADQARRLDPVLRADGRTSVADARAALCLAQGVPLDEIDPASGHDLTRRAYESVRASWRWNAGMHGLDEDGGLTDWFARVHDEALAWWAARRPEFTDGDDWLAGIHKPETEGA